jgi:predicted SpoU family rRNA methylase
VIHDRVALAARNAGAQEIIVAPGGDEALVEALVHWLSTAHASATLH